MQKQIKRKQPDIFDPNAAAVKNGNLYGLPHTPEEAKVVIIPAPWGVTLSYREGTELAPQAVLEASYQVDLCDPFAGNVWQEGIALAPLRKGLLEKAIRLRSTARTCIAHLEAGGMPGDSGMRPLWNVVNRGGRDLCVWVKKTSRHFLDQGKIVGVLGGDHSVPLGLMQALAEQSRVGSYGVLHIDAHFDLRKRFEGFTHSHASIMYNAAACANIQKIVHVGVRDYCQEEADFVVASGRRHGVFFDHDIHANLFRGEPWRDICERIIRCLPKQVYVSFDIDGLEPNLCPHTGTPVPGGLNFPMVSYLLEQVVTSGRSIIGFDLCEVAPGSRNPDDWAGDWDAAVGARVLYKLATLAIKSNKTRE